MGMQCTFSYSDLIESIPCHTEYDAESDTHTVTILREDELSGQYWQFSRPNAGDFCWFDCGSGNDEQMAMLKFLVRNRICFTCA
jgi:hypothetical protein